LKPWLKITCIIFLFITITGGLLIPVPRLAILHETIRNLFFHVPMWFAMIAVLSASLLYSFRFLSKHDLEYDVKAEGYARVGVVFGILGLITGSLWAKYTWGAWWTNDVKLNGAAATMLVYLAYFLLRNSIDDEQKRARISAVYSIFAFALMTVFIFILPRLTDSLHPGNGGNPAFNQYDLDNKMRMIFYPSVIGWVLLAFWIGDLRIRLKKIQNHLEHTVE
jgi:heme exporter protein C